MIAYAERIKRPASPGKRSSDIRRSPLVSVRKLYDYTGKVVSIVSSISMF